MVMIDQQQGNVAPMEMGEDPNQIVIPDDEDMVEFRLVHQQNLQLGFVELIEPEVGPVFSSWKSTLVPKKRSTS